MPDEIVIPPINPDEHLYRKVFKKDYDPAKSPYPEFVSFKPIEHDVDGLSFGRAKYRSLESVALNRPKAPETEYFVAELIVRDLQDLGLVVGNDEEYPPPNGAPPDPGHAIIPSLNAANRREDSTIDFAKKIANLCVAVHGPYRAIDYPG